MVLSIQPFLEPRGFIRGLEFVFAIAAFATVTNFVGWIGFDVKCNPSPTTSVTSPVTLHVPYPYHTSKLHVKVDVCNGRNVEFNFYGDFSSEAQFFVTTGVLSMLWSMATIGIYLLVDQTYRLDKRMRFADFGVTLLLATFWISGSAAWANGLHGLKTTTDPSEYIKNLDLHVLNNIGTLTSPRGGNFAPLTISVLLGFLNFVLWAGNTWFLYKEIKDENLMDAPSSSQSVPPATSP